MPVYSGETKDRRASPAGTHAAVNLRTHGKRLVLYVEDNPANVRFMSDLLGAFGGLELITAPTAESGIDLARTFSPAMIVMDINLPGMSGIDALRALQAMPETSHIPVIALTAAASEHDRKRGKRAGFYRYLAKPIKVDELQAALQAVLGRDATTGFW
jgi:CheY-like chemotaxis protein